eukprot:TRINITY_DN19599_c1_g1_i1.p1 TRINITY_DN19599_c1_g1~~TRINITY_DN19599_c1_g1_i1.p1  ORF type:complete len:199 (-),score=20.90 TRINITY_DN19599_c1_g1_i1:151-711(-)
MLEPVLSPWFAISPTSSCEICKSASSVISLLFTDSQPITNYHCLQTFFQSPAFQLQQAQEEIVVPAQIPDRKCNRWISGKKNLMQRGKNMCIFQKQILLFMDIIPPENLSPPVWDLVKLWTLLELLLGLRTHSQNVTPSTSIWNSATGSEDHCILCINSEIQRRFVRSLDVISVKSSFSLFGVELV